MEKYELTPEYDSAVSFYHKAYVIDKDNKLVLESYGLPVCEYDKQTKRWFIICDEDDLTMTTCRHIREFLQQQDEPYLKKSDFVAAIN